MGADNPGQDTCRAEPGVVTRGRTNSVLVQGQPGDLKTIEALLMRLDVPADKHGSDRPRK